MKEINAVINYLNNPRLQSRAVLGDRKRKKLRGKGCATSLMGASIGNHLHILTLSILYPTFWESGMGGGEGAKTNKIKEQKLPLKKIGGTLATLCNMETIHTLYL